MSSCGRCAKPVVEPRACSICTAPLCLACWDDYGFCASHLEVHRRFEEAIRLAHLARLNHGSHGPSEGFWTRAARRQVV
jgi:hypothetical protein